MRILIVTVAGLSSRFGQSIGRPCIKCLYHNGSIKESLLYRLLSHEVSFDKYIIVGGYKFAELKENVETSFAEFREKAVFVENKYFEDYGSGYSLYLGLKEALRQAPEELIFAEGDLYVDSESYIKVCNASKNVITYNSEPILADKAVAFYYDRKNRVHYLYDTGHKELVIPEPFMSIYNSGQIWKFADLSLVNRIYESICDREWKGTNLEAVEKYFQKVPKEALEMIGFHMWIN